MKKLFLFIIISLNLFNFATAQPLPTSAELNTQLETAQKQEPKDANTIKNLEDSIALLKEIEIQKQKSNELQELLKDIDKKIQQDQSDLVKIKQQLGKEQTVDEKLTIDELQKQLDDVLQKQKSVQDQLNDTNSNLVRQNNLSINAQTTFTENTEKTSKINALFSEGNLTPISEKKYTIELELINLTNNLNKALLKNNDQITLYYQTHYDVLQSENTLLQEKITGLQTYINDHRLKQSQEQLEQTQNNQLGSEKNKVFQSELDINAQLGQQLLENTKETNILSQEEFRLKNILNNLTQTEQTLEEQITALKGTLVLSRIIQKQKQNLPLNTNIEDLAEQISELRVYIFDITQKRNSLYNINKYIENLQTKNQKNFDETETQQLTQILTERKKLLSDLLTNLNNKLNISINLDLVQKQVFDISQKVEEILIQQSFWVESNTPINEKWLKQLPKAFALQIQDITKKLDFSKDNSVYFTSIFVIVLLLSLIWGVVFYFKTKIKKALSIINGQINSLNADSQWHTPLALFYVMLLRLPNILVFYIVTLLLGYFCFTSPTEVWMWGIKMAGYLWLFSFILNLFNPKGIAVKHFGLSEESCKTFRKAMLRGMVVVIILLNISIFTNVAENGIAGDVIGQILSIFALIFCIFILAPSLKRAVKVHNKNAPTNEKGNVLLTILRLLIQFTPIALIALISMGYYYTSLKLISLTITSYIIIIVWLLIRYVIYRSVQVTSRRIAYRRIQEQRLSKKEEKKSSVADDVIILPQQSESIKLDILKSQIIHITNIILWVVLFGLLYQVWAELIVSADYLNNVALWQQTVVTEDGTKIEAVTLFNLLIAFIILTATYILVRNIDSILEILIFSRITLSQGTPYTITTLLTYGIVAIGSSIAFSSLGMSWAKLQWLFAALSVGLGFGLQEIFANFISGIIILFERPIRIGDVITVGEFTGTVSKIRIRATTLMDFDGKEVIVPNKNFVTERLTNWALSSATTRLIINVGVAYGSDLVLTKKLLLQAAEETKTVLKDPAPVVFFLSFGASTLDHELRVYVGELADRNVTIDALNRRIDQLFAENGIEIAFNQMDIFIKNQPNNDEVALPKDIAKYAQAG